MSDDATADGDRHDATTDADPASVGVYDHLRPAETGGEGAAEPGVYRVVGAGEDAVTLLRVADADGRRRNTGEVRSVARAALAGFERAGNPDANPSVADRLTGAVDGFVWSLRNLVRSAVERPVVGLSLAVALLVGYVGEELGLPADVEAAGTALAVVLLLVLAFGWGR